MRSLALKSLVLLITLLSANLSRAEESRFVDCSLVIAPEYPCTWPSYPFPRFQINQSERSAPESVQHRLAADRRQHRHPNRRTAALCCATRTETPEVGPLGLAYTDKIDPWQFGGEACVVDVQDLLDKAPNGGQSAGEAVEHVERFEQQHRKSGW